MKLLHRPDLYGWSTFDEARNIDFNSILWQRRYPGEAANVVIDPLPMTEHDWQHLESLGGVKTIIVTNSDHVRDTAVLRARTGATVFGPFAEASTRARLFCLGSGRALGASRSTPALEESQLRSGRADEIPLTKRPSE